MRINPVDRHGVLNQVVGADGEKVDFGRKVGTDCRRRHLDHHSDGHLGIKGHAFLFELVHALANHFLGAPHFGKTGNHREHDRDFTMGTGP